MKWPEVITTAEARRLQEELRRKVRISPRLTEPRFIAGVDAVRLVLSCTAGFRIPEPLRCGDMLSRRVKLSLNP